MKRIASIITLSLLTALLFSCTKNKIDIVPIPVCEDGGPVITYSNHIAPLIKAKCSTGLGPGTGCHDAWILTYDGLMTAVNNGTLMKTTVLEKTMPKIPNDFGIDELTEEEIDWLVCWMENGAPNN